MPFDGTKILSAQLADNSHFWHDADDSKIPFVYPGYNKLAPHALGWKVVPADTRSTTRITSFEIDRDVHEIGSIIVRGSIGFTGGDEIGVGTCTKKRFINHAPSLGIERVRFWTGTVSKKKIEIEGNLLFIERILGTTLHEKEYDAVLDLGDMTEADRDAAAAGTATQDFLFKLYFPFDSRTSNFLNITALRDNLVVDIVWKEDTNIIDYDGTTAITVVRTNLELWLESVVLFNPDHNHTIQGMFMPDGIPYYRRDIQYEDILIQSTTSGDKYSGGVVKIDLKQYNQDCAFIFLTARWDDECDNIDPTTTNYGYDNCLDWVSHNVSDGTQPFVEDMDYDFLVKYQNPRLIYYPPGGNFLIQPFAMNIVDRSNTYGSVCLSYWNRGYFNLTLTPTVIAGIAGGRTLRVTFNSVVHNVVRVIANGTQEKPDAFFAEFLDVV